MDCINLSDEFSVHSNIVFHRCLTIHISINSCVLFRINGILLIFLQFCMDVEFKESYPKYGEDDLIHNIYVF